MRILCSLVILATVLQAQPPAPVDNLLEAGVRQMQDAMRREADAVASARAAFLKATYLTPRDDSEIRAKLEILISAELALSLKQAEVFASFRKANKLTDVQVAAIAKMLAER